MFERLSELSTFKQDHHFDMEHLLEIKEENLKSSSEYFQKEYLYNCLSLIKEYHIVEELIHLNSEKACDAGDLSENQQDVCELADEGLINRGISNAM